MTRTTGVGGRERTIRLAGRAVLAAATLAALCLSGCFMLKERFAADEPISREHVGNIVRGATGRREILAWFGPPTAVARRGTTMVYPPPGPVRQGWREVRSDTFFELFSPERRWRGTEIVYYYDASRVEANGFVLIPLIGGGYYQKTILVERLWLLIDESTGIVEDYAFRGPE
jgi:hypothetical protein